MSFDMNSITSAYSDYIKDSAAAGKLESTLKSKGDLKGANDEELMDACKKFESYFLEQVFKEMWKTVDTKESSSASMNTLTSYFRDEFLSEMATRSTETNSTGLAQMLYEQMKRNYDI